MAAGEDPRSRARTRRPVPELAQPVMLGRVIQIAAEGGTKVGIIAGGVGHKIVAPVIKDPPVRIGETVCNVTVQLAAAGLEPINRGIGVTHRRAPRSLNLRPVKYAVA